MSRKRMNVLALAGVVLMTAAVVVLAPSCSPGPSSPGAGAAKLLPADSKLFLTVANVPKLIDDFEKSEAKKQVSSMAGPAGTAEMDKYIKMARKISSLHVSFHGVAMSDKGPNVGLVLIVRLTEATPLKDLLPAELMGALKREGEYAGAELHACALPMPGASVRVASRGKYVVVSPDKQLLEGVLDALDKGRKDSLADDETYRKLTRGLKGRDGELYVALPGLLKTVQGLIPGGGGREMQAAIKALGLEHVKGLVIAGDSAGSSSVRALMDPESPVYQLLAQPQTAKKALDYLPNSTVMFVAASIGDGKDTWQRLNNQVAETMVALGETRAKDEYVKGMQQMQQALGIDFAEAASLLTEVGVFMDRELGLSAPCLFAVVNDAGKAEATMQKFVKSDGFKGMFRARGGKSEKHLDVMVHQSASDFVWAIVDNALFIAPKRKMIEKAITAQKQGNTLAKHASYQQMAKRLPDANTLLWYADLQGALSAAGPMPPQAVEVLKGAAFGMSLGADDGVVRVEMAQTTKDGKEMSGINMLSGMLLPALGKARKEATKVKSASNLKQIAMAANMWMMKFGDNSQWPPSLKSLYDKKVIEELRVFRHPTNPSKPVPGGFASDYESVLDRAGYKLTESMTPVSSLPLAWEKRQFFPDGRNVAFFDGHVEFLTERRFQQLMKQVDAFIKKNKPK